MGKRGILLLLFILFIASACESTKGGQNNNGEKIHNNSFNDLLAKENIKTIEIRDGKTGETVELVGEEKLNQFFSLFDDLILTEISNEEIKGYQYLANIGSDQVIFSNETITIGNRSFKTDKKVPLEKIKTYFNQKE